MAVRTIRWTGAVLAATAVLLSACSIGKLPPSPGLFDLGPPPARTTGLAAGSQVQLIELTAPVWLASPGIAYRLDYSDAYRREIYRDSRWVAPPAALLTERLRQRFAATAVPGDPAAKPLLLRLELEEFAQFFSGPSRSEVRLRVRARVGDAQLKVFEISRPSGSADAAGAVQALSAASDDLGDQLLAWLATLPP